jgi:hypothetical protein
LDARCGCGRHVTIEPPGADGRGQVVAGILGRRPAGDHAGVRPDQHRAVRDLTPDQALREALD